MMLTEWAFILIADAAAGDPDMEPDVDAEDGDEDCCEAGEDRGSRQ